ncbi:efflux transporter outer membrane subunit [Methylovulum psychrotolerans]|uniref:RND transporter n=1 Tax=Methylovulum psychrotolerans TaxID=1704499 RepID=A0A1Z4BZZ2_9GAMM|nr:efflux transporter outer membrane subunit [Methylovulum psychrotolerans]ASF46845.1 RND transporter [Methylovulum psychrotolerans]
MKVLKNLLLLLVSVPLLTACALLPKATSRAKLLAMPSVSSSLGGDAQAEQIVRAWPNAQWWLVLHNAELNRLLTEALQHNPSLHTATARVAQAEALSDSQAAELLPSVNANVDLHQRQFSGTDFYGPNGGKVFTGAYIDPIVFRYHIDLWGKDKATLEAMLGKEHAQAAELAMARLLLSTAITRTYIRLCAAQEDLDLYHELTGQAEGQQQLAQVRWQRGLTSQDPVYASGQQVEAARQQEASIRNQAHILRHRLAGLAGQGPDWGEGIHPEIGAIAGTLPPPDAVALGLLVHRPDVAAALWQVQAAAKLIKVAQTRFYPDINLVGFAGLRSLNLKDLFLSNGASVAYGVGPTLSLPIFEGGRLAAALKNQQAAYDIAAETYNGTLLAAVQQVADSVSEWRQTVAHDASQARALEAAKRAAQLADQRYQAGLSPRDGVLVAESALLRQRLLSSERRAAHLLAAVGLIEALGGGYQMPTP